MRDEIEDILDDIYAEGARSVEAIDEGNGTFIIEDNDSSYRNHDIIRDVIEDSRAQIWDEYEEYGTYYFVIKY
jgi:hypothetical protein